MFQAGWHSGVLVTADVIRHIEKGHMGAMNLLEEALIYLTPPVASLSLRNTFAQTVDFGRIIGEEQVIQVNAIDLSSPALFAVRAGRQYASRVSFYYEFVRPTRKFTMMFSRHGAHAWKLSSAWIGKQVPRPYWYPAENHKKYWLDHAFAYNGYEFGKPFESTWRDECAFWKRKYATNVV